MGSSACHSIFLAFLKSQRCAKIQPKSQNTMHALQNMDYQKIWKVVFWGFFVININLKHKATGWIYFFPCMEFMSLVMHCNGQTKGVTTEKAQKKGTGTGTIGTLTQDHRNSGEQGLSHQPKTSWFSTLYLQSKMAFISSKKEKSRDIGKKGISSMRKHMGKVLMLQGGKNCCVYTYILIYLFSVHFIIKISLQNRSFSQKSPEQKSLLTAKEAGGREGPGRAGTQGELLLFPVHRAAQKFTFQGEEHHWAALTQSTAAASSRHSICPKSAFLL